MDKYEPTEEDLDEITAKAQEFWDRNMTKVIAASTSSENEIVELMRINFVHGYLEGYVRSKRDL